MQCFLLLQVRPVWIPIAVQVCLFSYGQTGAGKTHTMQGSKGQDGQGIIPRAILKVCPLHTSCIFTTRCGLAVCALRSMLTQPWCLYLSGKRQNPALDAGVHSIVI